MTRHAGAPGPQIRKRESLTSLDRGPKRQSDLAARAYPAFRRCYISRDNLFWGQISAAAVRLMGIV